MYVREDIPTKLLSIGPIQSEYFFAELNLPKRKRLIPCSYIPHKNNISKHTEILSKNLVLYSSQYESNVIIGDFNIGVSDPHMNDFCNAYNLSCPIKKPTCYKNLDNPSCIDLILRNSPRNFQGSCVVETGLKSFRDCLLRAVIAYGAGGRGRSPPPPPKKKKQNSVKNP